MESLESNEDTPISSKIIINTIIEKSSKCSQSIIELTHDIIESVLSQNKSELRQLSKRGIPDDLPILRSLIWKINLNYLPIDNTKWIQTLQNQRKSYNYYKEIFTKKLKEEVQLYDDYNTKSREEKKKLDAQTNKKLLEDITKDVNRTHLQLSFFFKPKDNNKLLNIDELKTIMEDRRNCNLSNINKTYQINEFETHADVIARILFIYAKFSPDVTYAQGMNEILAPIYYTFSFDEFNSSSQYNIDDIEADTFWTFTYLMDKLKCVFTRDDGENFKYYKEISAKLENIIKIIDIDIYNKLLDQNVNFSYFAPRWFICLFAQDLLLVDVLRLWDYLFADDDIIKSAYFFATAVLVCKKDKIMGLDMGEIMKELNNFEGVLIEEIINKALEIEEKYGDIMNDIINGEI